MDEQSLASETSSQSVDLIFKVLTEMIIGSGIKPSWYY